MILRILFLVALMAMPLQAQADVFVYEDPDYDFKIVFPDDWRISPARGEERVKIKPMHGDDKVSCAMNVVRDGRLTIYPKKYMQTAVALTLDDSFWKYDVLPDYTNYKVMTYYAPAGLGQGYATSLQWVWHDGDDAMQAMSTASIYGDLQYRFTCMATVEAFGKWQPLFGDIFDDIRLTEKYVPYPTGYYRNFLK